MANLMVEILTPDKTLYWGRATALTARAVVGEVQILPGHAPYVAILKQGELRLHTEDNRRLSFQHGGGILEVAGEKTSVLVYPVAKGSGASLDQEDLK